MRYFNFEHFILRGSIKSLVHNSPYTKSTENFHQQIAGATCSLSRVGLESPRNKHRRYRPPQKYLYFVVFVGHVWPNDSERSATANVATGTDSNGGQVEGDDEEHTRYSGPSGWGLKREANDLTSLKKVFVEKPNYCRLDREGWASVVKEVKALRWP
jgi:hypothetical protein